MCMTETASGPIETPNRISVGDIQPLSCLVIGDKVSENHCSNIFHVSMYGLGISKLIFIFLFLGSVFDEF